MQNTHNVDPFWFIMHLTALLLLACVNGVVTMVATDPNICPRKVTTSNSSGINTQLIFDCCPDYFFRDGKCQECPAGKWGQDCLLECMPNYHGVQCKQKCDCLDGQKCDPVHGCICDIGFTGPQCSNACSFGTYGVQCGKECVCAHDAECDPVSGVCLCPAGWFGNHCTKACTIGTYGINCTEKCMCAQDAQCDPVTGECLCPAGWFGDNCSKVCVSGTYGMNCNEECFCAHDATCDPTNGDCVCPDGWIGDHCTKECPSGKYGINCSGICNCSVHDNCDVISGDCNSQKVVSDAKVDGTSGNTVIVYIMMAAALTGLICVVAIFVKVKDALCRNVKKCQKNSSKQNMELRKAKRRLQSAQTQDAQTESSIIDTETSMFQYPMEADLYCEIGDIDDLETDRYEMHKH